LFPKAARRLPDLPPTAVAGFLEVGSSLQVSQNPVAKDQPFEESEGSFDSSVSDGHFQRTMSG